MNEKELPRVLDRNGREIKLGDRVRIIADEVNKFMHDCYKEDRKCIGTRICSARRYLPHSFR